MSIASYQWNKGPDKPIQSAEIAKDVTLAFAIDEEYLLPMKVMIASMYLQGTLLESPIAIYSMDPKVFDDPFVRQVADRHILIDGDRRERLIQLAEFNVRRADRLAWNKGTFLKWAVFEEQFTTNLLFLDVDMLCRAPLEPLIKARAGADLVTAPQFQTSIFKTEDGLIPQEEVAHTLEEMIAGRFTGAHTSRINSGMMLIGPRLLNSDAFYELTSFASESVQINEQSHMSAFFKNARYKRVMSSVRYNFQASYLERVALDVAKNLLSEIAILHFAGGRKPWQVDKPNQSQAALEWSAMRERLEILAPQTWR